MILEYAYTAYEEQAMRPRSSSAARERMRAKMKAARPFLTANERQEAAKHVPLHIFQAVDVEKPKLD